MSSLVLTMSLLLLQRRYVNPSPRTAGFLTSIKILNTKSRTTFDLPSTNGDASSAPTTTEKSQRFKFTDKEMKKIAKLTRQAKSIQEINALEKSLAEGRIPGGADSDDEMEG